MWVRQVLSNYLEVLIPTVPLTCSIPMWRAASGSELSKWNLTAENKSPWPRAASANAWHSSDEGRPHCRHRQGVEHVKSVSRKNQLKDGRSDFLLRVNMVKDFTLTLSCNWLISVTLPGYNEHSLASRTWLSGIIWSRSTERSLDVNI